MITQSGIGMDLILRTNLMRMFIRCGDSESALNIFHESRSEKPDSIMWSVALSALVAQNRISDAISSLHVMTEQGIKPNQFHWSILLEGCNRKQCLDFGKQIHSLIDKHELASFVILKTNLIKMYVNCGGHEEAWNLFQEMRASNQSPTIVTWTIILRMVASQDINRAIDLMEDMKRDNIQLDSLCWSAIILGAKDAESLNAGKKIHSLISENIRDSIISIHLIDMYSTCGDLDSARRVFADLKSSDQTSDVWAAIIRANGIHGFTSDALQLFKTSKEMKIPQTELLITAALLACSHVGLVDNAKTIFREAQAIIPLTNVTFNTMVDVLARAKMLDEAEEFISRIPRPDAMTWTALLAGCKKQKDVIRAEKIFPKLRQADPENSAGHVLMANIYASLGKPNEVKRIRKDLHQNNLKKDPGISRIEISGEVHQFYVEDKNHPMIEQIHQELKKWFTILEKSGFEHNYNVLLREFSSREKAKEHLCAHSEKLAIGLGLILTPPGTKITATMNLRVCEDCHTSTKALSKITQRKINLRDANRWHYFKDGYCSCNDYW